MYPSTIRLGRVDCMTTGEFSVWTPVGGLSGYLEKGKRYLILCELEPLTGRPTNLRWEEDK